MTITSCHHDDHLVMLVTPTMLRVVAVVATVAHTVVSLTALSQGTAAPSNLAAGRNSEGKGLRFQGGFRHVSDSVCLFFAKLGVQYLAFRAKCSELLKCAGSRKRELHGVPSGVWGLHI